ncbi:MAG: membrane protein insertion efficiency factor YidD [Eubacteriales bacterium]
MSGKIKNFIRRVHGFVCGVYILPIKLYRRFVSPLKGVGTCRFTPTCSQYAIDAVREWGIIIGTALAFIRLVRCNPFSRGGVDEVPKKSEFFRKK